MRRLSVVVAALALVAGVPVALAKPAMNRPYVQSGPDGVFYARCVPKNLNGIEGTTAIYRVGAEEDELIDTYPWYSKERVVLGWSPIVGKVAVVSLARQEANDGRGETVVSFYIGGKLLKAYTADELRKAGVQIGVGGKRTEGSPVRVIGCEQIYNTNHYVFAIGGEGEGKVCFDITTGEVWAGSGR